MPVPPLYFGSTILSSFTGPHGEKFYARVSHSTGLDYLNDEIWDF